MKLDFTSVWQYWPFLYHGALLTLKITAICAVLGFLLGIVLALVKISKYKPLIWFGRFYTSIFRGTPLLVQLCIVHFWTAAAAGFHTDHHPVRNPYIYTELRSLCLGNIPWRNHGCG